MKTLKNTFKLAVLVFVLVFASCNKDDDYQAPEPQEEVELTTSDMLITGPWNLVSLQYPGSSPLTDCEKQTTFNFVDEDTLLLDQYYLDAGTNCISDGVLTYDYVLNTSDELLITAGGDILLFEIQYITDTQLILTYESGGDTYTYSFVKI